MKIETAEIRIVRELLDGEVDEIERECNIEAHGDGLVVVDTDALENGPAIAGKILKALGDYHGLVHLNC